MGLKQTYIDGQYMKTKYLKIRDKNGEANTYYGNHRTTTNSTSDERHIGASLGMWFSNFIIEVGTLRRNQKLFIETSRF